MEPRQLPVSSPIPPSIPIDPVSCVGLLRRSVTWDWEIFHISKTLLKKGVNRKSPDELGSCSQPVSIGYISFCKSNPHILRKDCVVWGVFLFFSNSFFFIGQRQTFLSQCVSSLKSVFKSGKRGECKAGGSQDGCGPEEKKRRQ